MPLKFKKWGNSLAVRFPQVMVKEMGVREGTVCNHRISRSGVHLMPIKQDKPKKKLAKELTLEEMCALITPENLHHEFEWGGVPVGKEVW